VGAGLVADANVAAERAQLAKVAEAAGIPYLVDPVTALLQDEQAPDHPWARLSFATAERLTPADLAHPDLQDELVERTLDFQREHGSTLLIPPYLCSAKRGDGWLDVKPVSANARRPLPRAGEHRPAGSAGFRRDAGVRATLGVGAGPRPRRRRRRRMNLRYVTLSCLLRVPHAYYR
jgi:hypothetical protein